MKIEIKYESSWRNSFLDGSNNEPLPTGGRKFVGSMTSLKTKENYIARSVTHDTVMGLLNRLLGDQRKLYQARGQEAYYFKEIEPLVTFEDQPDYVNQEMTYIRNITGSTDQNSFSGMIQADAPMLLSDYSQELWGILDLSVSELCDFIVDDNYFVQKDISTNPLQLVAKAELLGKESDVENDGVFPKVITLLNAKFSELVSEKLLTPFVENSGKVKIVRLYSAALYLQLERLSSKFEMVSAVTKTGKVAGFSKRGFNGRRDFMKNFVTGGEKKIWGNPFIRKEKIKGIGEVISLMEKAGGTLNIDIAIDRAAALDFRDKIENAGVSSFYLGKKGLAYVSDIRV
jgi:hypothetical protein